MVLIGLIIIAVALMALMALLVLGVPGIWWKPRRRALPAAGPDRAAPGVPGR